MQQQTTCLTTSGQNIRLRTQSGSQCGSVPFCFRSFSSSCKKIPIQIWTYLYLSGPKLHWKMNTQQINRASHVTKRKTTAGEEVGDNMVHPESTSMNEPKGIMHFFLETDVAWTKQLAVCAIKESSHGEWRPVMRALEYSAHGVPWLVGNVVALLVTHQLQLHQTLFNLFYGKKNGMNNSKQLCNCSETIVTLSKNYLNHVRYKNGIIVRIGKTTQFGISEFRFLCWLVPCSWP